MRGLGIEPVLPAPPGITEPPPPPVPLPPPTPLPPSEGPEYEPRPPRPPPQQRRWAALASARTSRPRIDKPPSNRERFTGKPPLGEGAIARTPPSMPRPWTGQQGPGFPCGRSRVRIQCAATGASPDDQAPPRRPDRPEVHGPGPFQRLGPGQPLLRPAPEDPARHRRRPRCRRTGG